MVTFQFPWAKLLGLSSLLEFCCGRLSLQQMCSDGAIVQKFMFKLLFCLCKLYKKTMNVKIL